MTTDVTTHLGTVENHMTQLIPMGSHVLFLLCNNGNLMHRITTERMTYSRGMDTHNDPDGEISSKYLRYEPLNTNSLISYLCGGLVDFIIIEDPISRLGMDGAMQLLDYLFNSHLVFTIMIVDDINNKNDIVTIGCRFSAPSLEVRGNKILLIGIKAGA